MFIVKIPGINGEKSAGCERAGNAIIDAVKEISSNEQGGVVDSLLFDLEEIHLDNSNLKLTNDLIYKNSLEIFAEKPKTIFLGGDQSISYSVIKAFNHFFNNAKRKNCVIIFDAHADCLPSENFPTSRSWIRKLIETGFSGENILIVGVRNISQQEIKFLRENKIRFITMSSLTENLQDMCDTIMEFSSGKELYVSIDIDVVDPVFAPATANPESAGLTNREFIYLIQRIKKIKNLRAVDITEINEKNDKNKTTIKLGAKILSELI
jgi:agmatinase